jgi:hypothetical protein
MRRARQRAAALPALACWDDVVGVASGHFGDRDHSASFNGVERARHDALQHADALRDSQHGVVRVVRHCCVAAAARHRDREKAGGGEDGARSGGYHAGGQGGPYVLAVHHLHAGRARQHAFFQHDETAGAAFLGGLEQQPHCACSRASRDTALQRVACRGGVAGGVPRRLDSCDFRTRAAARSMAVWLSWPHACILPANSVRRALARGWRGVPAHPDAGS